MSPVVDHDRGGLFVCRGHQKVYLRCFGGIFKNVIDNQFEVFRHCFKFNTILLSGEMVSRFIIEFTKDIPRTYI